MSAEGDTVQFMSQMTAVEYKISPPTALAVHTARQLVAGRIIGHKCPQCGNVYVPPRGYCPICVVPTTEADEVELEGRGTVTTFSVITPLQYQGQEETDDYVQATILLDGSDTTIGMQRLDGIAIADVHSGLRVEAIWKPESKRSGEPASGMRALGLGDAIEGWKPTGEPDPPLEQYAKHIV